jgi:Tol biopolymer transport system component
MDLLREGALSRVSELGIPGPEFLPVWSPDANELLFSRGDERHMRLLRRPLNGGTVQTVLDSAGPKFPSDWSSDGRFLLFSTQWPDYHDMHVWEIELEGCQRSATSGATSLCRTGRVLFAGQWCKRASMDCLHLG